MTTAFIDIITSLTAIMEEETARLLQPGRRSDLAEMTTAKIKLVGMLEAWILEQDRTDAGWLARLDDETRDRLSAAIRHLGTAAQVNKRVIDRQIDLSTDMMAAVAAEARRLTGTRRAIYGATGVLSRTEVATPISINASL